MSTKNIDAANHEGPRVNRQPAVFTFCCAPPSALGLNVSLCRSFAAIAVTWAELTRHRLQEHFRLSRELAGCTSLPAMLHVYSEYCKTAIRQYQDCVSESQQIALKLACEGPVAGFVEHTARHNTPTTTG
jgi:hypothetical protein